MVVGCLGACQLDGVVLVVAGRNHLHSHQLGRLIAQPRALVGEGDKGARRLDLIGGAERLTTRDLSTGAVGAFWFRSLDRPTPCSGPPEQPKSPVFEDGGGALRHGRVTLCLYSAI